MTKTRKHQIRQATEPASWFSRLSPTLQDALCVAFLYVVTLLVFRAIIFENAAFASGGDTAAALSYTHAGNMIRDAEKVDVVWMPYFFSGMPTFGNVAYVPHDVSYLQKFAMTVVHLLYLNSTWGWYVVYYLFCGVFMFFLARAWNLPREAALLAALTYMLSPYGIGLAAEGHGSKLMALSYIPLLLLLAHIAFERRNLLTFGLLAAGIGTLMLTNHMQIVYYGFFVIGLYLVYQGITDFRKDKLGVAKKTVVFLGSLLLGFCIASYIYLSVYEYAQYSIRGGGTTGSPGGLTWDYATSWSFHPWELLTLFVPSFFGFSSSYMYPWQGQLTSLPLYWGTMPFNTSTVYIGVIPILFSILALVYRRTRVTVFLGILSVLVLLISFGKHLALFYQLLFNVLPFFNKFRAPAMILHLLGFAAALLGAFGLDFLFRSHAEAKEEQLKKLKKALVYGLLGVVAFLLIAPQLYEMFGGTLYVREGESYGQQTQQVIAELKKIRSKVLWDDIGKFVLIAGSSIALVWLYLSKTIRRGLFSTGVIAILLVDLLVMDANFIHPQPGTAVEAGFRPTATVQFLKQQPGLFRVFPVGELFMDNTYAYHGIQSIGGYSPAKLKIYQTMIDSCLYRGADPNFPLNMNVVDMLNVQFLLAKGQLPPGRFEAVSLDSVEGIWAYRNDTALPRAFVVGDVIVAPTQSQVFREMNAPAFRPAAMAVVEKPLDQPVGRSESSSVRVTEYSSRRVVLDAYTSSPALLVLSEIYYPAGWQAFIDGEETEIYKTNYILRSVVIPAGKHQVVFEFESRFYQLGWIISNAAWGAVALCVIIGVWQIPSLRGRFRGSRSGREKPEG